MSEADSTPAHDHGYGLRSRIGLVLGPAVFLFALLSPAPAGLTTEAWRVAAVALFMAIWWITEAVPIPATSLLPLAVFPTLGIAPIRDAATPYANPIIFLFMGGFMLAKAMQRWSLHRRVALRIIRVIGTEPRHMIGGFMAAAGLLSMWILNTSTTVMMLPIGLSVIELVRQGATPEDEAGHANFGLALMLGIAYAANIGGMGTLIGTAPNALLAGFLNETFGIQVTFLQWMMIGVPMVVVLLPLAWFALTRWIYPVTIRATQAASDAIEKEVASLGPLSRGERITGIVFLVIALSWVLRPILSRWIPGLSDAGLAVIGALALFIIPVDLKRGTFALDWRTAVSIPWDALLLFGGGLSLAAAIQDTGLAVWLGSALTGLGALPLILLILIVVTSMVFLTELTSNTASTAAFLPVLASMAVGIGEDPRFFTIPAVIAASCAFMLPVATPPNAIVFGSGLVPIPKMARAGLVLNLMFSAVIPLLAYLLIMFVFGARSGVLPAWAGG